ncbi:hypothetical protein A5725_01395 [Mycobacterium kubicae]|nr:hypothetical protein A5725_01395 [Mycobacterium kubicae]OBK49817.1 hypothetical protein A5657_21365 [Mycobacterium kubicae]
MGRGHVWASQSCSLVVGAGAAVTDTVGVTRDEVVGVPEWVTVHAAVIAVARSAAAIRKRGIVVLIGRSLHLHARSPVNDCWAATDPKDPHPSGVPATRPCLGQSRTD